MLVAVHFLGFKNLFTIKINIKMSKEIKFRWVGFNKHFNEIAIKEGITTKDLLTGNYPSFFSENNRRTDGNCEFISEDLFTGIIAKGQSIYVGDIVQVAENVIYEVVQIEVDEVMDVYGCFALLNKERESLFGFDNYAIPNLKKIGNKYENPELL